MDLSLLGPGPGPGLDAEQASVRQEVVKLITLLDRYLFLRGDTLTSYDAHFPSIPAREFSDAIPVSLQYFPPVSLASHLEKQAGEKAEMQNLTAHIVATCLDPRVTKLAKLQVMEAYAYLSPANDSQWLRPKALPETLAIFRAAEKRVNDPDNHMFSFYVVKGIKDNGEVSDMQTVYRPIRSSWKEVQERLSTATVSWQANLAGFPDGYNLSHGKWMYQVVKDSMPDKEMHELVTTEQYCDMRGKMYNDGVEALVWHDILWTQSQEARARAADEIEEWRRDMPLNADGTPMFHDNFDPWSGGEDLEALRYTVEQEMEQPLSSPSFEPLSDEERDPIQMRRRLAGF